MRAQYLEMIFCRERDVSQRRNAMNMPAAPTDVLRKLCLALPEAIEKAMKRGPTYRVRGKIFAMDRQWTGVATVWCKAPPGSQHVLVGADPLRFFVPPYVGAKGWIGVRLEDDPDWDEVAAIVRRSHRLIATSRSGGRRQSGP
jgi:predicted DNA-binding protein (MmcQ/YjbR family)